MPDLPQSCDPNIPLVAQELMKRMIRQFAIEYASKSQIQGGKNGSSLDTNLVCDSRHPSDQDGPLDLTVNRNHLNVEQGKQLCKPIVFEAVLLNVFSHAIQ